MVTAYARLRLLDELHKIEASSPGRVLYFDTDSVIFVEKPLNIRYKTQVGGFLGDMTNEIEAGYGGGAYIDGFASGGPKNYAYRVRLSDDSRKEKVKVKKVVDGAEKEVDETTEENIPGYLEAVYHLFSMALKHGPIIIRMRTADRAAGGRFVPRTA